MGLLGWLRSRRLLSVSLRRRIECPLSATDDEVLDALRPAVEDIFGDSSDATVIRLALGLYSRLVLGPLPSLYRPRTDGQLMDAFVVVDRVAPLADENVKRRLRLALGFRSFRNLRRLGQLTEQDVGDVVRSALATTLRAVVGDTRSFYVRLQDGSYGEFNLIDIALMGK